MMHEIRGQLSLFVKEFDVTISDNGICGHTLHKDKNIADVSQNSMQKLLP